MRRRLGAVVLGALLLALVAGGLGRAGAAAADDHGPCHAQVNCVGQIANTPLGASSLPVTTATVTLVSLLVVAFTLRPVHWHDRLSAGRLFRPPRLLG